MSVASQVSPRTALLSKSWATSLWVAIAPLLLLSTASRPGMAQSDLEIVPNRGHASRVERIASTPDGRLIATAADRDPVVRLWDGARLVLLRTIRVSENIGPEIALSADGATLAAAAGDEIALWDTKTGAKIRTLVRRTSESDDSTSGRLTFIGKGTALVVEGDSYGKSGAYDATSGSPLAKFGDENRGVDFVTPAASGGPFVATVGIDDGWENGQQTRPATTIIEVHRTANWSRQSSVRLAGNTICMRSARLSEDGQKLWCLGDNVLSEIDVRSGRIGRSKELAEKGDYESAGDAFSPDGRFVWAIDKKGHQIRGWDVMTWAPVIDLKLGAVDDSPCADLVYDIDTGKDKPTVTEVSVIRPLAAGLLAACKNGTRLLAWDTFASSRPRSAEIGPKTTISTEISEDGTRVAVRWEGHAIGVLDVTKLEMSTRPLQRGIACKQALSVNASKLAYQCDQASADQAGVHLWEPGLDGRVTLPATTQSGKGYELAMSQDGRGLALHDDYGNVYGTDFNVDGTRLATVGIGTIGLFDTDGGEKIKDLIAKKPPVPPGTKAPGPGDDDSQSPLLTPVHIWNAQTGALERRLDQANHKLHRVVWSPDGRLIAGGYAGRKAKYQRGDGRVTVWSAETGKTLWSRKVNDDGLSSLHFTPDNGRLVMSSMDGPMHELDARTGRAIWSVKRKLGGRWTIFSDTAVSGSGQLLAAAAGTITARRGDPIDAYAQLEVFRHDTREVYCKVTGLTSRLQQLAFSPDSTRLLGRDNDDAVRIWSMRRTGACELLATLYVAPEGEWILLTPEGFFASSPTGARQLNAVRGHEVFSIDQLFERLYKPDVVRDKLAGKPVPPLLGLTEALKSGTPPVVNITAPSPGTASPSDEVAVTVTLTAREGGVGRVEWLVDRVVVGIDEKPVVVDGRATLTRKVPLDTGMNTVEVVAYNARNIVSSSPSASIQVKWSGDVAKALPTLHVLAVGIDTYKNPALNLKYAVADAESLVAALEKASRLLNLGLG